MQFEMRDVDTNNNVIQLSFFPYNPFKWRPFHFSLNRIKPWVKHWENQNKESDHQLKKLVTVKQCLHVRVIVSA